MTLIGGRLLQIAEVILNSSGLDREPFGRGPGSPLGENLEPGRSANISSIGTFGCRPET